MQQWLGLDPLAAFALRRIEALSADSADLLD